MTFLRDPTSQIGVLFASFSPFRQSCCVSNRNVQTVTQHRATFVHCARLRSDIVCARARARVRRRWLVDDSRAQGTGPAARRGNSARRSATAVKKLSLFPRSGRVFLYVPGGGGEHRDKPARKGGRPDVKKRGCSAVHQRAASHTN